MTCSSTMQAASQQPHGLMTRCPHAASLHTHTLSTGSTGQPISTPYDASILFLYDAKGSTLLFSCIRLLTPLPRS
jgi:hypothetical protein